MQAKRALMNKLEQERLKPHLKNSSKDPSGEKKERTVYVSSRANGEILESSKLNITSLFDHQKEPDLKLKNLLENFLVTLYKDKGFFDEEEVQLLVDSLIEKGKSEKPKALTDLYPKDDHLKEVYYKMLKSNISLEDYITISQKSERKPVCFKNASIPLLQALFGKDLTDSILELEETNYFTKDDEQAILKEPELKDLLNHAHFDENVFDLLQFKYPAKEKKTIKEENKKARIFLNYKINNKD